MTDMEQSKLVREPRQKRSVDTKNKVLDAAYKLYCDKGYYETTTNEIAKVAGVNIGSLYSYFQDKKTILLEVVDRYHASYLQTIDAIYQDTESCEQAVQVWMRRLIDDMIHAHQETRKFNRELNVLSYSVPEIAAVMEDQHSKVRQITVDFLERHQKKLRVKDVETAAIVTTSLIDSIVHQIVFGKSLIDRERILKTTVDAIYSFLMK
jgi:AcrR family transcriptional regulator